MYLIIIIIIIILNGTRQSWRKLYYSVCKALGIEMTEKLCTLTQTNKQTHTHTQTHTKELVCKHEDLKCH